MQLEGHVSADAASLRFGLTVAPLNLSLGFWHFQSTWEKGNVNRNRPARLRSDDFVLRGIKDGGKRIKVQQLEVAKTKPGRRHSIFTLFLEM